MPLPTLNFPILREVLSEPIERVKVAQFDDGYETRRKSGINPIVERWTLKVVINFTNKASFKTFLDAVGKHSPFLWASPQDATVKKWLIDDYGYEYRDHEEDRNKEWIYTLKIKQTFNYG
jgi:phage-related protein